MLLSMATYCPHHICPLLQEPPELERAPQHETKAEQQKPTQRCAAAASTGTMLPGGNGHAAGAGGRRQQQQDDPLHAGHCAGKFARGRGELLANIINSQI